MSGTDVIDSVGAKLESDLKSDDYDRYVIFTYGISSELLPWFDSSEEVVICGPDSTMHEVFEHMDNSSASVDARSIPSHAKIFLMWGDDEIKCWLGSFNFTSTALFENVEWAASFEGNLSTYPTTSEVLEGELEDSITDSWPLNQIIELISSTFRGEDTGYADSLLLNTDYPYVLVHTHRSNTLKHALREELKNSNGPISITYYAPFVNARGIELFVETLTPSVSSDRIDLTVRTCRLRDIENSEGGLTPEQVEGFTSEFAGFDYLVRAPGDQGDQLLSGDEIRSGFAHHKAIFIEYSDEREENKRSTLLTSANLTKNAWQHSSGNFEIGLLLRDDERNEQLHELFGDELGFCYERPRDRELEKATAASSESSPYVDTWLEDYVTERLNIGESYISLDWSDWLPKISKVEANVSYRDLHTAKRNQESIILDSTSDGFEAPISPVTAEENSIIDFVRLDIETRFRPPDHTLTPFGIDQLLSGDFDLEDHPCDVLIWGDERGEPDSIENRLSERPDNVILRRRTADKRRVQLIHEPHTQPHLSENFIQWIEAESRKSEDTGELIYVDVGVDPAIEPRHDHLIIVDEQGVRIDPLGYGRLDTETIRFILDAKYENQYLLVTPAPPLDRYYKLQELSVKLPSITGSTNPEIERFNSLELTVHAADGEKGEDPVIDDETPIRFDVPSELPVSQAELYVVWGYRGYDRFGEFVSIDRELEPQEPHRQIWYHGAYDSTIDGTEITFLSQRNSFTVKEQPFARDMQPRSDLIPAALNLDSLSNHELLTWLVFERSAVLKDRAREGDEPLTAKVSENGETYETIICDVLEEGGYLCIPLLGLHRDEQLRLRFILKLHGSHPEVEYYAPGERFLDLQVETTDENNVLNLNWGDETHRIRNQKGTSTPTLNFLMDQIRPSDLAEKLFDDDPFVLNDREGLAVRVQGRGLLHLASK